jgi:hypothetical protein
VTGVRARHPVWMARVLLAQAPGIEASGIRTLAHLFDGGLAFLSPSCAALYHAFRSLAFGLACPSAYCAMLLRGAGG